MYDFHIILALTILVVTLSTTYVSPAEGKSVPGDPRAVEEVMSGKRKEAKASWWGFDPEDAKKSLSPCSLSQSVLNWSHS